MASSRSAAARIAALHRHGTEDSRVITEPARRAFLDKFLRMVPTDLPEDERLRRAGYLRREYMARLALGSAKKRRRRLPKTRRRSAAAGASPPPMAGPDP